MAISIEELEERHGAKKAGVVDSCCVRPQNTGGVLERPFYDPYDGWDWDEADYDFYGFPLMSRTSKVLSEKDIK